MGRPPCCDKVGIKKGPWTPEEDIILVSYIQEHGPGNWRSVPTNTGLLRCSKSCRLRWTNYLRPGIKRGNFTPHEEGMIIHLQALLDHSTTYQFVSKSFSDKRSLDITSQASTTLSLNPTSSTYASSTENISKLLEGWMRSSPKTNTTSRNGPQEKQHHNSTATTSLQSYRPKAEQEGAELMSSEEFESILSFHNLSNIAWDKSSCDSPLKESQTAATDEKKQRSDNNPPLSFLEKWLLDETTGQVEEMMELPQIF
ncbi:hypothetical protein F0562_016198 [Nyssa sinensis]|uniref:Uncharacterized protein n=1 Tax=Nyssa sinensis TaxID=561372 RepID=A0A5J4ZMZ6_9ASTE|nr:hypothetical protein F0562_016198 [Nyssa sinensis]